MSQAQLKSVLTDYTPAYVLEPLGQPLSTVVYRSKATQPLSYDQLHELSQAAQSRNHAESLTGVMLYDDSCFFQWLEGPAENIARVMASIRSDSRHCEIEVLSERPIAARMFGGWDMKLATRTAQPGAWAHDVIYPKLETVTELRRHPEDAPALLVTLAPKPRPLGGNASPFAKPPAPNTSTLLKNLLQTTVMPELAARHGIAAPGKPQIIGDQTVLKLADMLLASDATAALALIHEAYSTQESLVTLFKDLLEPAARRLGDMSVDDLCSEYDVTIGLCQLQTAIRLAGSEAMPAITQAGAPPAVLVVPQPGELHAMGAAMDSELMWQEGWAPQSEYPTSDAELQQIVKDGWFDVLDLSLSTAIKREHWLPRLATTISLARRASLNPDLVIVAGGRVFHDEAGANKTAQADIALRSATGVTAAIIGEVKTRK